MLQQLYNEFGTTTNIISAGYMLNNGIMLDFSEPDSGTDERQRDHIEICCVIDYKGDRMDAYNDFLNSGNIRLIPETSGINLGTTSPTAKQYEKLSGYIFKQLRNNLYFMIEFTNENGQATQNKCFEYPCNVGDILKYIEQYYN